MSDNSYAREREAVLRRAFISVKPDYFSWPLETQERYRVNIPREDSFCHYRSTCRSPIGNGSELLLPDYPGQPLSLA